jgi:diamine N-acetyltransferase
MLLVSKGFRLGKTNVDNPKMKFNVGGEELLDHIKPLWQGLTQHMLDSSTIFKKYYASITFEKRKNALLKKTTNGEMHITIALDEATGEKVGYCISSVDDEKTGEIDSIFVGKAYRGLGVGGGLIKEALVWMDTKGAKSKIVAVGAGNEGAFGFYNRFGFQHRKTMLEQV